MVLSSFLGSRYRQSAPRGACGLTSDPILAKAAFLSVLVNPPPSLQNPDKAENATLLPYNGTDVPHILQTVQNRPRSRSNASTNLHSRKGSAAAAFAPPVPPQPGHVQRDSFGTSPFKSGGGGPLGRTNGGGGSLGEAGVQGIIDADISPPPDSSNTSHSRDPSLTSRPSTDEPLQPRYSHSHSNSGPPSLPQIPTSLGSSLFDFNPPAVSTGLVGSPPKPTSFAQAVNGSSATRTRLDQGASQRLVNGALGLGKNTSPPGVGVNGQ
jgi:hypothetical protein